MEINNNQSDKEKITPGNPAQGEDDKKSTEDKKTVKLQKELDDTKKKLSDKETQAAQLTTEIQKLRQKEPLVIVPIKPKVEPDDFQDDDIDAKVEQKFQERASKDYINRANRCYEKFSNLSDVELYGDLDIKFRKKANSMNLGETDDEVLENFQLIYSGLTASLSRQKKDEEKKDSDLSVGDGGAEDPNRQPPGKVNWLTKKLNKYEQEAAKHFPGGEKAYREKWQKDIQSA